MTATTRECRTELTAIITSLFGVPDTTRYPSLTAGTVSIKGYMTTPDQSDANPNTCIIGTIATTSEQFTLAGNEEPSRFVIFLFARLDKDDSTAEASRSAAEDWLDDAEEMILTELPIYDNDLWVTLDLLGPPRRDTDKMFWSTHRTSQIAIEIGR